MAYIMSRVNNPGLFTAEQRMKPLSHQIIFKKHSYPTFVIPHGNPSLEISLEFSGYISDDF